MTSPRIGIDTSVLMRLVTEEPRDLYNHCVEELSLLVEDGKEVFASNLVIGEAYFALQHHYGAGKEEARSGLLRVLRGGLVRPQNGEEAIAVLMSTGGIDLVEQLIVEGYTHEGLDTLTLDPQKAGLPGTRQL